MHFDPVFLSRFQFAWVIAWHILLPAFTVGCAAFIALGEGLSLATGREVYARISIFWTKIFSIAFGMGVVTGIVMPFQFGTNWSGFSDAVANVLSPLFAYEGLTAFFLESAFLGVLLFGRKLVPPWVHFVAALMVAMGTLFSSFWIVAANSWMQTPSGYEIVNGQFFPKDWIDVIFNPSFPFRLAHTVVGFCVTTAFVVLGVGALSHSPRTLRRRGSDHAVDDTVAPDRSGSAADDPRRSARSQHARSSAGKARGDRSALGYRSPRTAHTFRHPG
jgi:cytochrome d ubiquinol oxidase subunit I